MNGPLLALRLLSLWLLLGLGSGCNRIGWEPRPPADAPSVVLVTIDTLRADHVGAYGAKDVSTPTLDGLARDGVRFETAITATPITLPSHTTLFTGRDAPDHGVRHNGTFRLDAQATTLAERFRAGGWSTGAFVGALVLKSRFGLDQGFEVYDDDVAGEHAAPGGFIERPAGEVVDSALRWVATTEGPFFLWVHLYDPHMNYKPPPEYLARFPDRPYDAEIAYSDAQVGRLLAELAAAGRADRTLVVVTSDHGEGLGEHGENTHSTALYDSVLAVPLLMRGPGVPAGRVVEGVVRLKDVGPTILAQAGLDPLPEADGEDLTTQFGAEGPPPERVAYSETLATLLDNGWAPLHSIRTDEWLYVRSPRPELYEVARDPRQLNNLVETAPERARPHQERLDRLVDAALADERNGSTLALDAETKQQLHALGYAVTDQPVVETGIDPKDGRKYLPILHRAMGAYDAGNLPLAEALFVEVTEKLPASGRSHSQLASIYFHDGRYERALRHAELAISFDPRSSIHHVIRGEVLLSMGKPEEAWAAYQQAVELEPDSPWSKVGLQWGALRQEDRRAAERHAREALDESVGDIGVFLRVALLWSEYQEFEKAARVLEEAVRMEPDSEYAHVRLAIEYARTERPREALAERRLAGDLATNEKLGTMLGRAFAAAGDFDRAEWQLREVLAVHPGSEGAEQSLTRVEAWRRKLAELGAG